MSTYDQIEHMTDAPGIITPDALKSLRRAAKSWRTSWRIEAETADNIAGVWIMTDERYRDSRGIERTACTRYRVAIRPAYGIIRASMSIEDNNVRTLVRTLRAEDDISVILVPDGVQNHHMHEAGLSADSAEIIVNRKRRTGGGDAWSVSFTGSAMPADSQWRDIRRAPPVETAAAG